MPSVLAQFTNVTAAAPKMHQHIIDTFKKLRFLSENGTDIKRLQNVSVPQNH